jgi:hypothetical protein
MNAKEMFGCSGKAGSRRCLWNKNAKWKRRRNCLGQNNGFGKTG